jgi:hypothetical protein
MAKALLAFGKNDIELADPSAVLDRAFDSPVAGPSLVTLAQGRRTAATSICDITRPVPNRFILPAILSCLHAAVATKVLPLGAKVAVVPKGPYVFARLSSQSNSVGLRSRRRTSRALAS